jgi:hypothetical protein
MKAVPLEAFGDCQKLLKRFNIRIQIGSDYYEWKLLLLFN